jgi:hypothetical protein
MPIAPQIAPKLQRLLLLLSSNQPGEVVAAAAAIKRTLRTVGCDFHDLVAGLTAPSSTKPQFHQEEAESRGVRDWHVMRKFCVEREQQLRPRELEFVTNLADWRGNLTPKQRDWPSAIYARLQRAAA